MAHRVGSRSLRSLDPTLCLPLDRSFQFLVWCYGADDAGEAGLHLLHGEGKAADLVVAVQIEGAAGKVAGAMALARSAT